MSLLRFTMIVAVAFVVGNPAAAAQQTSAAVPDKQTEASGIPASCPITKRPATPFIPPWPYPAVPGKPESHSFWFGTDRLWTILWDNLNWKGFREKLPWYQAGYDWHTEPKPKLIVSGKRLDGPAPALAVNGPDAVNVRSSQPYIMVGIGVPTPGCWEITGRYGDDALSYVVWVWQ